MLLNQYSCTNCCFAAVSVQPTYSYYEKVSEELEKIVHEVKVNEEVETLTDGKKQLLFYILKCKSAFLNIGSKFGQINQYFAFLC